MNKLKRRGQETGKHLGYIMKIWLKKVRKKTTGIERQV